MFVSFLKTIQGEGMLQGMPSLIIRTLGCNLNCAWCDNNLEKESYENLSLTQIIERVESYSTKYVIITGGEPTVCSEIVELTKKLKELGKHVTIETNGTVKKRVVCDLISISPKLQNSNPWEQGTKKYHEYEKKRCNIDNLKYYVNNYNVQLKFVVQDVSDFEEVIILLQQIGYNLYENVFIMPNAKDAMELKTIQLKIVELCIEFGFRYANRLQLQLWENDKNENEYWKEKQECII